MGIYFKAWLDVSDPVDSNKTVSYPLMDMGNAWARDTGFAPYLKKVKTISPDGEEIHRTCGEIIVTKEVLAHFDTEIQKLEVELKGLSTELEDQDCENWSGLYRRFKPLNTFVDQLRDVRTCWERSFENSLVHGMVSYG